MDITNKLKPYIAIADMIGDSFGKKCEAVIHDLTKPENSVVYVSNGIITNRQIGQSFDHLIKQVILSKEFTNDYRANYTFTSDDGREIKSSTSLIRDENDEVIGAFCINFEMEDFNRISMFLKHFLADEDVEAPVKETSQKKELGTVTEIIDSIIDNTIGEENVSKLKKSDNMRIIAFLHEKGVFLAKGSVDKVAERMEISPVTVYSYLDKVKKNKAK